MHLTVALLTPVLVLAATPAAAPPPPAAAPPATETAPAAAPSLPPAAASAPAPSAAPASVPATDTEVMTATQEGLGTLLKIMIVPRGDATAAKQAMEAAFREMKRIDSLMSESVGDSEVSRINRGAGKEAVPLSPETLAALTLGKRVSELSGGAASLTAAALAILWDFNQGEAGAKKLPDALRAQRRVALVDDQKLVLDAEHDTAKLSNSEMAISLGDIARGVALDRAIAVLSERGFGDALVFAGGDIAVHGAKGARPWLVGLQDPRSRGFFATVPVHDEAMVSAGDYERFFEVEAERYHDVLDPKTGFPAKGVRSVTVFAKDAATAGAFARAVFVLGPEKGMQLIDKEDGLEAVMVDSQNNVVVSTGIQERLRVLRPPTGAGS